MKLEDIKLGMKVIITQDRTGNGWTTLHPDVAKAFIGKVGNVRGMWIPSEKEDKRAFIIDVKVDELYDACGDVELLGKIGKISEKTSSGCFMIKGDTYRCFPISSLKSCRESETQSTYDSIQEELATIKKMLARISEKADKLIVDRITSEKAVLKVGDWVQYISDEKTIYGKIFQVEEIRNDIDNGTHITTSIDGKPWIISVQDLRILSKQEIYYRLNE